MWLLACLFITFRNRYAGFAPTNSAKQCSCGRNPIMAKNYGSGYSLTDDSVDLLGSAIGIFPLPHLQIPLHDSHLHSGLLHYLPHTPVLHPRRFGRLLAELRRRPSGRIWPHSGPNNIRSTSSESLKRVQFVEADVGADPTLPALHYLWTFHPAHFQALHDRLSSLAGPAGFEQAPQLNSNVGFHPFRLPVPQTPEPTSTPDSSKIW